MNRCRANRVATVGRSPTERTRESFRDSIRTQIYITIAVAVVKRRWRSLTGCSRHDIYQREFLTHRGGTAPDVPQPFNSDRLSPANRTANRFLVASVPMALLLTNRVTCLVAARCADGARSCDMYVPLSNSSRTVNSAMTTIVAASLVSANSQFTMSPDFNT